MARAFSFGYRCAQIRVSRFTLSLGVVLAGSVLSVSSPQAGMAAWANDPYALKTIDFVSSGGTSLTQDNALENRTDVMLYTGGIVPYRTVYSDPNKTILEFDEVNASDTVNTHFMGTSGNITHVIVQPLNDNKLRLILRGENLGQVTVGFKDPQENVPVNITEPDGQETGSAARAGLHSEFGEAFDQMKSDSRSGESTPVHSTVAEPLSTLSLASEGGSAARFNQGIPPRVTVSPAPPAAPAPISQEFNPFAKKTSPSTSLNHAGAKKPASTSGRTGYTLDTVLLAGMVQWAAPSAMLLLLMAGLGWFIRHKWVRLNQGNTETQTLAATLPLDASVNQRADQTHDWKFEDGQGSLHLEEIPLKVMPKRNAGMDSPIGLGSLLPQDRQAYRTELDARYEQEAEAEAEAFYDPARAEREWISQQRAKLSQTTLQEELTARPLPQPGALKQPVPQKQALNRYAQNPLPATKQPIAAPMGKQISPVLKNDLYEKHGASNPSSKSKKQGGMSEFLAESLQLKPQLWHPPLKTAVRMRFPKTCFPIVPCPTTRKCWPF